MGGITRATLQEIKERQTHTVAIRSGRIPATPDGEKHLMICGGTASHASGSQQVLHALKDAIDKHDLSARCKLIETGSDSFATLAPALVIYPEGIYYVNLTPEDTEAIVTEHLITGHPVERLLYRDSTTDTPIPRMMDIPYFALQKLITLRNYTLIDPEQIDEAIGRDAYQGAAKALLDMSPDEIISQLKASGLRGRGGAGFPTGLKWEFAAQSESDTKYVLCNADEGDPGAFMDRSVLEADPHAVIEGMIIAAKAIGAHTGYIYCRAEYPLAIKRLHIAIQQARSYGLLGDDILKSTFSFDLEIYQGAGAFVCGEETALMTSIEGKRGMPRQRPPFPAQKGLWGKPTVLNNVETLATVPQIIVNGGAWYAGIGTEGSKGTKVFALSGKVDNSGLVEVPMGMSLTEIVYAIGGGVPDRKRLKAVQLGGPSGGCIPAGLLDTVTDYEAIATTGAIMGSGGMVVMDEHNCMVDIARFFMEFLKEESCGQCNACREGIKRMLEVLTDICEGRGREGDIEQLERLGNTIKKFSLCGLGQTAPNPVLSTLRYFRDEYEEHIREHRCRAGVCPELVVAPCINACPLGQMVPGYISLIDQGRHEEAIALIRQTNPLPGIVGRVCNHPCMEVCTRAQTDEPINIPTIKRFAADTARNKEITVTLSRAKEKPEQIAIIGGGPSGLAAAYYLSLMGYRSTIFDQFPHLGGMLRYGIPAYRLPRDILDEEIEAMVQRGVTVKTGITVGKDISLEDLRDTFAAVFIGIGAHTSQRLGISGEELDGVYGGAEFLRHLELGTAPHIGTRVGVIGGGNVAIDVARTCRRMGAQVTILYRREQQDMPASEEEIADALAEGITLTTLMMPHSITTANGKLALTLQHCEPGAYDSSGRRKPTPVPNKTTTETFDTIFAAIGQVTDTTFAPDLTLTRGWIAVDRQSLTTNLKNVYAGGDVITGPAMVVDALAAGKRAALAIDWELAAQRGEKPSPPSYERISLTQHIPGEIVTQPMARTPKRSPAERITDFGEVDCGFDTDTVRAECGRCLRCDVTVEEGS